MLSRMAPIALNIINLSEAEDMQRLSAQQGLDLIFTNVNESNHPDIVYRVPCVYSVFGLTNSAFHPGQDKDRKEVIIALRGTASFKDLMKDLIGPITPYTVNATSILKFLSGASESFYIEEAGLSETVYARKAVVQVSIDTMKELGPSILRFSSAGYQITFVGHGYGGAVAAMISRILKIVLPAIRCVTYGCPSFIDETSAEICAEFLLSVVLHDDIVPRLNLGNSNRFAAEVKTFYEKVFRQPNQDWTILIANHQSAEEQGCGDWKMEPDAERKTWIPGRILHLYLHRGQYQTQYATRTFPSFQKIELSEHIITDHQPSNIMNALLEARAALRSVSSPPQWTKFDTSIYCCCCNQRFTWYSNTARNDQALILRNNCNCCGALVCGNCSNNYHTVPKYGMIIPKRICDKCYLSGEYALL
jgi:hypothetical protein